MASLAISGGERGAGASAPGAGAGAVYDAAAAVFTPPADSCCGAGRDAGIVPLIGGAGVKAVPGATADDGIWNAVGGASGGRVIGDGASPAAMAASADAAWSCWRAGVGCGGGIAAGGPGGGWGAAGGCVSCMCGIGWGAYMGIIGIIIAGGACIATIC